MAKKPVQINIELDKQAIRFFKNRAPNKLTEARTKSIEACGKIWADESKDITRAEDHIDTSTYINSIGYITGTPNEPPIYELKEGRESSELLIGSSVDYAATLEKRYSIMARGLDRSISRMEKVTTNIVKNTLDL